MDPALNDRPLKRHPGACFNGCNSVTKGVRDMGPSVIKALGLLYQVIIVNNWGCCQMLLNLTNI